MLYAQIIKLTKQQARRNAFVLCALHKHLNAMLTYYKSKMCTEAPPNLSRAINVVSKSYWGS